MTDNVIQPTLIEEPEKLNGRAVYEAYVYAWHLPDEIYERMGVPRALAPVPWPGVSKQGKEQFEAMAAWLNKRFVARLQKEIEELKKNALITE